MGSSAARREYGIAHKQQRICKRWCKTSDSERRERTARQNTNEASTRLPGNATGKFPFFHGAGKFCEGNAKNRKE